MPFSSETLRFILDHRTDDVRKLALQAARYPAVDFATVLTQIAGWQVARVKIPSWAAADGVRYPVHLSMEQCSGEPTARYKATVVKEPLRTLVDLTGGFGIDCYFLSAAFERATYVERQAALCELARHNFPLLGKAQIDVVNADGVEYLQTLSSADWIFLDPARRDGHGGKVVAIADCEPDVCALEPALLSKAVQVLVKLSPMLDLTRALHELRSVEEVHVVSVDNECKELLVVLKRGCTLSPDEVRIVCVNLSDESGASVENSGNAPASFAFTKSEEAMAACPYTSELGAYLYEPNASLLKAGAYRSVAAVFGLKKLHPSSHLYTSDTFLPRFPGRKFAVEGLCGFGKTDLKALKSYLESSSEEGGRQSSLKANLTIRNFPASVAELRRKLKINEGGNRYLFATTLADERCVLVWGRKL